MTWTRGDVAALALTLALAALLRASTLALPHDRGDQLVFAGLAAHVTARGPAGYTLRGLDYRSEPIGSGGVLVRFAPGPGEGRLLKHFKDGGETFWDAPLASQPPVFVLALLASHALLGVADDGFPLVGRDQGAIVAALRAERGEALAAERAAIERLPEGELAKARAALAGRLEEELAAREGALARALVATPPPGAVRAQLWATLPQLLVDLATTALLFGLGRRAASARGARARDARLAGAIAALAFACDPLAVFAASRVLANGLLALLAVAALATGELSALAPGEVDPSGRPVGAQDRPLAPARPGSVSPTVVDGIQGPKAVDDGRPRGSAADRDTIPRAVLAGTLGGLATLAKVSGVFVLPALLLARRLERGRFAASDAWLAVAHLGLAVPWWLYRAVVLGNPFAFDTVTQPGAAASFWAERTMSRTPLYYLASLARSPLALVGLVVALALAARGLAAWRLGERARPGLAHALFGPLVVAAACVFPGKEARHVLHAYPSLLLLGGGVIAGLASRLEGRGRAALGLTLALVLGLEARHGLALAFDVARMP